MSKDLKDFGFIDYRKPAPDKDDFRTSTYIGHKYLNNPKQDKWNCPTQSQCAMYKTPNSWLDEMISEQRRNYDFKYDDINPSRNPCVRNPKFMVPFEDKYLRFPPKELKYCDTSYSRSYNYKPSQPAELRPQLEFRSDIKKTKLLNHPAKPGHAKYCDLMLTTNNLDFVPYLNEQINGIGANDNITYWTWTKEGELFKNISSFPGQMCEGVVGELCPKRHTAYQSSTKRVPNSGMTTEVRAHYKPPPKLSIKLDKTKIKSKLSDCPIFNMQKSTESKIYGSGERVTKYVDLGPLSKY